MGKASDCVSARLTGTVYRDPVTHTLHERRRTDLLPHCMLDILGEVIDKCRETNAEHKRNQGASADDQPAPRFVRG